MIRFKAKQTHHATSSQKAKSVLGVLVGFCKQVLSELPMEFAVEAQALLGVSLEGSVG